MIEASPPQPFVPEAASAALWPSIQETYAKEDDWEFVDTADEDSTLATSAAATYATHQLATKNHSRGILYRTMSSPDLNQYECYSEESSAPSDTETDDLFTCATSVTSTDPPLIVKSLPVGEKPVQIVKKPSFKDAILFKAQETAKEEAEKKDHALKQHQQRVMNRTRVKPKFVVQTMKRCAHSTGDLRSLSTIYDGVEESYCGGGGGGELATVHAEEVLGATDAAEFYARKKHGGEARINSLKLRPDEAKRKEFSRQKRDMQRQAQMRG